MLGWREGCASTQEGPVGQRVALTKSWSVGSVTADKVDKKDHKKDSDHHWRSVSILCQRRGKSGKKGRSWEARRTLKDDTRCHDVCPIISPLPRRSCPCDTPSGTLNDKTDKVGKHEDDGERAGRYERVSSTDGQLKPDFHGADSSS